MSWGSWLANWRRCCGVSGFAPGWSALVSFSNCARVISVLQSAGFLAVTVLLAPVLDAAAVCGDAAHTPLTVSTTAFSDTSVAGAGAFAAPGACAGGVPGCACPQASAPRNTHSNQLLCIQNSSRIGRSGSCTART